MKGRVLSGGLLLFLPFLLLFVFAVFTIADAQGLQTSPYSAPSVLRGASGAGLGLTPSNPLGLPGSSAPGVRASDTIPISSGMFPSIVPPIPNLQVGYLYNFGQNVRSGRFTADYLLPFMLGEDSAVYGEAHTEFQGFWKSGGFNNRTDVSIGGGYRTILRDKTLLGFNGFYDASRLGSQWYSSGGVGLEMAALLPGNDALDLNFNWYGQLFNGTVIRNAFRYGPSNFDVEAGYSHELWERGPDLRLKITGYQFDVGTRIGGWNAGAELKTRDGVFSVKYDVGNDRLNETYHTVGGFVNVGFRMDNILKGESPFEIPEPIFKSPRSMRRLLTTGVHRSWRQAAAVTTVLPGSFTVTPTGAKYCINATTIPNGNWNAVTPPFPDVGTVGSITLEWRGATASFDVAYVYISSAASTPGSRTAASVPPGPIFTITPGSGQITLSLPVHTGSAAGAGLWIQRTPLNFSPGGGLCITLH